MNSDNLEPLTPADVAWLERMEAMIRGGKKGTVNVAVAYEDAVNCGCADPVCPKVHPVDVEDEWTNREGMPEFNGSFR